MNENQNFHLIKGTFTADDASKILMEMIQNKIAYHNLQIFSQRVRFGEADTSASQKRIEELMVIKENLQKTLRQAEDLGLSVELDCPINVKLVAYPKGIKP